MAISQPSFSLPFSLILRNVTQMASSATNTNAAASAPHNSPSNLDVFWKMLLLPLMLLCTSAFLLCSLNVAKSPPSSLREDMSLTELSA